MSKYSVIPVTRKKWRRPAEIDFRVDIDGVNSATFAGPYAGMLANLYCQQLSEMEKMVNALPAPGSDAAEVFVAIQDHLYREVANLPIPVEAR